MLFKDTIKLKEYSELTASVNFTSIKATLSHVEEVHVIPIIGKELYTSLHTDYTNAANEDTLTEPQQDLLERVRKVIGPYLAYYQAAKGEVKLSDAGLRREETNSSKTAFQYQVANFRKAQLNEAEQQTELLLEFLEENIADYEEWTESKAFEKYRSLFITSGFAFGELFTTHTPYRNYWAMRSKMVDVEEQNIRHAIGNTLFDALKAKAALADPAFSTQEEKFLFKIKKAIAAFTVAFSIPFLAVRIDANGITISDTGSSTSNDELSKQKSASENQLSLIIKNAQATGEMWLNDAIKYLKENASAFSDWNEEEDTTPTDGTQPIYDNNIDLKGSFIL
jgi:hypothetical protein